MDENKTYTATLTFSTSSDDPSATHIMYEWSPPINEVLKTVDGDAYRLPMAYQNMAYILQTAVFPMVSMNERYEEQYLEDPSIADILDEINDNPETVH
jgi:hypothetical protein